MKKYLTPTNIIVVLMAIALAYLAISMHRPAPEGVEGFAQCLTAQGVELYTTATCPHCASQKALFGSSISKLTHYLCDSDGRQKCIEENIRHIPAWKINGEILVGEKSIEELSQLTGCELA